MLAENVMVVVFESGEMMKIRRVKKYAKKQDKGRRVAPDSRVKVSTLSPQSRCKRFQNMRNSKKKITKALNKALNEGGKMSLDRKNRVENEILDFMKRAGKTAEQYKNKFKNALIASLKECAKSEKWLEEEGNKAIEEFVTETLSKIVNFQNVISGKEKQVSFTAREIRLALILYNMSPAGYRELRESSLQIFPSERTLIMYRKKIKVKEGENPATYGTARDRFGLKTGERISAHLMVDEMKLKNDIYSNAITGELVGIASSDVKLKSLRDDSMAFIKDVLKNTSCSGDEESSDDEEGDLVQYVNQFRLRICNNVSISLEFFFNDGTLDGNGIMYQLFHVQSMLNNVGID